MDISIENDYKEWNDLLKRTNSKAQTLILDLNINGLSARIIHDINQLKSVTKSIKDGSEYLIECTVKDLTDLNKKADMLDKILNSLTAKKASATILNIGSELLSFMKKLKKTRRIK